MNARGLSRWLDCHFRGPSKPPSPPSSRKVIFRFGDGVLGSWTIPLLSNVRPGTVTHEGAKLC
eukprot:1160028-Pelagomonas_calceolata.AAC.1